MLETGNFIDLTGNVSLHPFARSSAVSLHILLPAWTNLHSSAECLARQVARFEAKFADKSFASVARGFDDEADDGKGGARPPWEADDDDDEW